MMTHGRSSGATVCCSCSDQLTALALIRRISGLALETHDLFLLLFIVAAFPPIFGDLFCCASLGHLARDLL